METNTMPPGQVTGSAPFYTKPEPLNPQEHGALGLKNSDNPFFFGEKQHFVPLLATEFVPASRCFPIIFAGEEPTPLAVMGLSEGENLFYEDGKLRNDIYVPAYMRRYPFITAAEETGQRVVVCIERTSPLIGENAETPFFENGELSQYSKDCIQFCENFEMDRARTVQMVARFKALDLFEPREMTFTPPVPRGATPPTPQKIAAFTAISTDKVNALPAETLVELRDTGYLAAIYAHFASQFNWEPLVGLSLRRRAAAANAN